ncbi:MAG TPA: hypothetical protein VJ986_12565 [Gaiellaceae bacterium]|nr:hypothetical protein [Gaiellaceae bacterium]
MRRVMAAVVCLAGLAVGSARAVNPPVISLPIGDPLPATLNAVHARPGTALTVTVAGFPLVCGRPLGVVKVVLPKAARLPHTIAARTVRLNGAVPLRVTIVRQTVSVTARLPKGITCHSIAAGPLTLAFSRAAGISLTPPRMRTVPVRHGAHVYRGVLRLSS